MGIYIHWPFCLSKCPYCDFNSHVRASIDEQAWEDAYVRSIEGYAQRFPGAEIVSIFFGGGTPSLMPARTAEAIISTIQKHWPVANSVEITLEANPTSVEIEKFRAFRSAGIDRVSIGVQAMNDADLKFLGREHSAAEALRAIETAQAVFERYSFDLMYARPEQSLSAWRKELENAVKFSNGHMSLYQLTIERNTPFYMSHKQGDFSIPDEDLAADFYNLTQDVMAGAGLPAYEVSNHACAGQESRHNLIYWHYGDYIGIGPGAHGRLTIDGRKHATREHQAPEIWLQKVADSGSGAHPFDVLSPRDIFMEALMMGVRLVEGVSPSELERKSGLSWCAVLDEGRIQTLSAEGWLLLGSDNRLTLTREGMLRMNAIIPYIIKSVE